jgi:hypothetical protein
VASHTASRQSQQQAPVAEPAVGGLVELAPPSGSRNTAQFEYVLAASQLVKPNVRDVRNGGLNLGRKPQLANGHLGVQQI